MDPRPTAVTDEELGMNTMAPGPDVEGETQLEHIRLELEDHLEELTAIRDDTPREDPRGRHLSLAITHLEDVISRVRQAGG